jgi:hypothetical protein
VPHDLGPWVNAYTIFKIRCWKGLSTNLSVIFVMIPFAYRVLCLRLLQCLPDITKKMLDFQSILHIQVHGCGSNER